MFLVRGVETMEGVPLWSCRSGRVYGRGAVDTRASLAIVLALLAHLNTTNAHLRKLYASADEETGCNGAPVFANWVNRQGIHLTNCFRRAYPLHPHSGHKGSVGLVIELKVLPTLQTALDYARWYFLDGETTYTAQFPLNWVGSLSYDDQGGQAHTYPQFCRIM